MKKEEFREKFYSVMNRINEGCTFKLKQSDEIDNAIDEEFEEKFIVHRTHKGQEIYVYGNPVSEECIKTYKNEGNYLYFKYLKGINDPICFYLYLYTNKLSEAAPMSFKEAIEVRNELNKTRTANMYLWVMSKAKKIEKAVKKENNKYRYYLKDKITNEYYMKTFESSFNKFIERTNVKKLAWSTTNFDIAKAELREIANTFGSTFNLEIDFELNKEQPCETK